MSASVAAQPAVNPESVARRWQRLLAPYCRADDRRAWFQLLTTGALFAANWALMWWSLQFHYGLTLLLALPAAGLITRLFIFQHDCGHGSFFSSQRLNHLVGATIGVMTLTPYRYWRRTHAMHHATTGNLDAREFGDIRTLTVEEYLALSKLRRAGYRLYRNVFFLMTIGASFQFILKHRLPLDLPRAWRKEWRSVMGTNLSLAVILLVMAFTIGLKAFLLVQLPITVISCASGLWLFYIQHQFEDTYWEENPQWNFHAAGIEGSSFYDLPAVLHWFTGNIGFHHVHHLASRIPNYRLQACFREVRDLRHVTRLTIRESLRCAHLALWDPGSNRLIRFGDLKHRPMAV
ncbi:MAG: fatty acid desaturase [Acidobacteriota bacterium]